MACPSAENSSDASCLAVQRLAMSECGEEEEERGDPRRCCLASLSHALDRPSEATEPTL